MWMKICKLVDIKACINVERFRKMESSRSEIMTENRNQMDCTNNRVKMLYRQRRGTIAIELIFTALRTPQITSWWTFELS